MSGNATQVPHGRAAGSKSDAAYAVLRNRIVDGSYSAGYRLVLDRLADELGFSTVPVREAVRKLEAEGLVTFQRNVGATVTGIDDEAYGQAMETLAILEGAATALSAPLLTKAEIRRAHTLNRSLRRSLRHFDPMGFTRGNQEFHELVCSRCPNTHLLQMMHREWTQLAGIRRSTFSYVPGRAATSLDEHEHILELIENEAAPEELEMVARRHKLGTLEAYERKRPTPPEAAPPN